MYCEQRCPLVFQKLLGASHILDLQAKEAKMKTKLDMLASYAMIPHGFQRHKGRIVRLAEECLEIARDGEPSTRDVAQRFVSGSADLSMLSLPLEHYSLSCKSFELLMQGTFSSKGTQHTPC